MKRDPRSESRLLRNNFTFYKSHYILKQESFIIKLSTVSDKYEKNKLFFIKLSKNT